MFIKFLEESGRLLRNYTQNIDTLEKVAGIERVVECHGMIFTREKDKWVICAKFRLICSFDMPQLWARDRLGADSRGGFRTGSYV